MSKENVPYSNILASQAFIGGGYRINDRFDLALGLHFVSTGSADKDKQSSLFKDTVNLSGKLLSAGIIYNY